MTIPEPTATHCFMCGHPVEAHDLQPDGTRPCRSIGHEKGVPCAECRRLTEDDHVRAIQELRGEETRAFADAWAAYQVTYDHFRQQVGDGWQAWFTDHHQSALGSALIAYRSGAKARVAELEAEVESMRSLVDDLRDPDPCWYDHHGYCQAHGWFETDPKCAHARAAEHLAEPTEEEK